MNVDELVSAIIAEVHRVFPRGFDGTFAEYDWLGTNYGVTEDEDVQWQLIIDPEGAEEDLDASDPDDGETIAFLENPERVRLFLEGLLSKYRANTVSYDPRHPS